MTPDAIRKRMGQATGKRAMRPASLSATATVTRDLVIPDINYGAWSFIGQPPAPDYKADPDWL